jgi:hypothetical protein
MAESEKIPKIDPAEVETLITRVKQSNLEKREAELITGLLRTLLYVVALLQDQKATLIRLREMIFGRKSEKRKKEKGQDSPTRPEGGEASSGEASEGAVGEKNEIAGSAAQAKRRRHGRNPATAYEGARKVYCRHPELSSGSACPDGRCQGKVYPVIRPHGLIQFTGSPAISATHYIQQVLRCGLCEREYEAPLPAGVKPQKYDETADAAMAINRYLMATPLYRTSGLQSMCGVPLSESTIFGRCAAVAEVLLPIYKRMECAAANAKVLYGDDTWLKIQESMKENKAKGKGERVGIWTSGILAAREDGVRIALYLNGGRHLGENAERLVGRRNPELGAIIRMSDALAANWSGDEERIECCCLTHARRKFAEIEQNYPQQCGYVLERIGAIYHHESVAAQMSDDERLAYHQSRSGPVMSELKQWMDEELKQRRVEPNSSLGKAIAYFHNNFGELTQFLRTPGAPIDNNLAEQILKPPVMIRKNSYFYRTSYGACVAGIILSVLITCRLNQVNVWNYLVSVLRRSAEVRADPEAFTPWNYGGEESALTPEGRVA